MQLRANHPDSPITKRLFLNTIPHCGTHLLVTILEMLGMCHATSKKFRISRFRIIRPVEEKIRLHWRTSLTFRNIGARFSSRSVKVSVGSPRPVKFGIVKNLLNQAKRGEFILGHVPYSEQILKHLEMNNYKGIFLLRDPRDVCVSMLNHIRTKPHHMAYDYLFQRLSNDEERMAAVIKGFDRNNKERGLIGINKMYRSMLPWAKNEPIFLPLKFEDIVGPRGGGDLSRQRQGIIDILKLLDFYNIGIDVADQLGESVFGKGLTFRSGRIGKWENTFSPAMKAFFKENTGDLLYALGYETSADW